MGESKKIFVYGAGISGIGVSEVLSDRGEQVILYNDSEKHWILAGWKILCQGRGICMSGGSGTLPEDVPFIHYLSGDSLYHRNGEKSQGTGHGDYCRS